MTDAGPDSGCPWVAPFAHRLGTLHHVWNEGMDGWEVEGLAELVGRGEGGGAVCLPVRAGDVVVFSTLCPVRSPPPLSCL
eukprot:COSAG04_NODE_2701_length_3710_cov_27.658820_2_plen_80_part_00